MVKDLHRKSERESECVEEDTCYGCGPDEWGENSERVWAAIHESMDRFLEVNQGNIRRSSKEKIASASYSGGMIDTIMVIKHALGNWAVMQFLDELESWQRRDDMMAGPEFPDDIEDEGDEEEFPSDGVMEQPSRLANWFDGGKGSGRRHFTDPMYA